MARALESVATHNRHEGISRTPSLQLFLSIVAHVIYATQPAGAIGDRTRSDVLRICAGLCRWLAMPLVLLHGLFGGWHEASAFSEDVASVSPRGAAAAAAAAAVAAAASACVARFDNASASGSACVSPTAAPVEGLAGVGAAFASSQFLPAWALERPLVNVSQLLVSFFGSWVGPVNIGSISTTGAFLCVGGSFVALRLLQVTLWFIAAPPAPRPRYKRGSAAAAVAAASESAGDIAPISGHGAHGKPAWDSACVGKLRILIVGDSVPPKVRGARGGLGVRWWVRVCPGLPPLSSFSP